MDASRPGRNGAVKSTTGAASSRSLPCLKRSTATLISHSRAASRPGMWYGDAPAPVKEPSRNKPVTLRVRDDLLTAPRIGLGVRGIVDSWASGPLGPGVVL